MNKNSEQGNIIIITLLMGLVLAVGVYYVFFFKGPGALDDKFIEKNGSSLLYTEKDPVVTDEIVTPEVVDTTNMELEKTLETEIQNLDKLNVDKAEYQEDLSDVQL